MFAYLRFAFLLTMIGLISVACSNDTPAASEPVAPDDISSIALADERQPQEAPGEDLPGSLTDDTGGAPADTTQTPSETRAETTPEVPESYDNAFAEMPTPDLTEETAPATVKGRKRGSEPGPRPKRVSKKLVRYVNATMLNVRSKPSPRAKVVRRLLGGTKITVELHGKYAKIKNGQWCSSRYLSATPTRKVSQTEAEQAWRGKNGAAQSGSEQAAPANP